MDTALKDRLDEMITSDKIFLFMKGNPTFPQCGFSNQVVQILKAFDIPFGSFDVLSDQDVRQGIKEFSDWPTIPQLYVDGDFVGGCDIVRESWESGELEQMLKDAFPDREVKGPKPPSRPKNITPAEAKEMIGKDGYHFLDVRTPDEIETAKVDGFELLDQALAQKILNEFDKETHMVFMCHYGGRSAQAAEYFAQQGFGNIYNVQGGIDAWSQTVDESVPRY